MPNGILLYFTRNTGEAQQAQLSESRKTVHYYMNADGDVTAFTPISSIATKNDDAHRDKIRIEIEDRGEISSAQIASLKRLLVHVQKEVLRIYAEPLPFHKNSVVLSCGQMLPLEELLEEAYCKPEERRVYRVQTGCYQSLRDAEERVERLSNAGIASYITEVREG